MEGPTGKGEESSKKVPATTSSSSGRRGKEVLVNAINPTQPTPQQYSMNFTTSPTAAPAYFPPPPQHQDQSVYYSVCAPEFYLVRARMREAYATRLGSVHLPGDARRTHVRRSRHLLFTTRRSRAVESLGSRGTGVTVHRTVRVDSLREPKPRIFELTYLSVTIARLDRFDTRTSRLPIGDPYK
ncbi:hypothetical protein CRG98_019230 [Punica granatum]|uniref:Uncharacterized protein n=1 Tax=Punica granatum TaxID=22663 RepID=A0A2I0JVR0_PUNGR|nr:hypothetical protein CRG98_019230 [Punica granatum]